MSFDGAFLHKTIKELRSAIDCHVDKIYQPSKDELVLLLRKKGFAKKMLITVKSGAARIHFTENKYENPQSPPMFCMLIRKYLSSARLVDIIQPSLERVAVLVFSTLNEMGDLAEIRLVCELIGNKSNLVLVGENGKIIDALRHSDIENEPRLILPNCTYSYPEKKEKLNPLTTDINELLSALEQQNEQALLNTVEGFSPLICREIAESRDFTDRLSAVLEDLRHNSKPTLILKPDESPYDFSYTDITQYGTQYKSQSFESFSLLLDAFYSKKESIARINQNARDIIRLVNNLISRTQKRLSLRLCELKKCENREQLRIYGELLKANLYAIPAGAEFAEVPNYYDENLKTVKIPLNPALNPQGNANKYFKDYKKTYTAEQTLTKLTENDRAELLYLESVLDSISRLSGLSELEQVRMELCEAGYIKKSPKSKQMPRLKPQFKELISKEGYKILIGKNNLQNDYLTTELASKTDLWFHVKGFAGSHVLLLCEGKEVSQDTIIQAATLAAENSQARLGSNVAVDYTPVKNVKKPRGAKAGMVTYTVYKTVYVTPREVFE